MDLERLKTLASALEAEKAILKEKIDGTLVTRKRTKDQQQVGPDEQDQLLRFRVIHRNRTTISQLGETKALLESAIEKLRERRARHEERLHDLQELVDELGKHVPEDGDGVDNVESDPANVHEMMTQSIGQVLERLYPNSDKSFWNRFLAASESMDYDETNTQIVQALEVLKSNNLITLDSKRRKVEFPKETVADQ